MRGTRCLTFLAVMAGCLLISQPGWAQGPELNPPVPCIHPDVDKPHSACPDSECWSSCTDAGYQNTSAQAVTANVIYAQCCYCCGFADPYTEIYQDIVGSTGNVGQFPEEETEAMLDWIDANCPRCTLYVDMAHDGYAGQDPVDPQNVSFAWADQGEPFLDQVKIWVVAQAHLPVPPAPTGKQDLSQELTYMGRYSNQAYVHDPDCDVDGRNDNFYVVGSDANGEYLQDYFGPGIHGYLHGVIRISGPPECSHSGPSLTEVARIVLVVLMIGSAVFMLIRRRRAMVAA
jgi:hypothetical protein